MIDESIVNAQVSDNLYVHDSFASIFRGMLDWFSDVFDTRFSYKAISTYDKAVQFFNSKKKTTNGTVSSNILPSITLDPNLDFVPEEKMGKLLWQYSNLNPLMGRYFADRINLRDQGVVISAVNTRYQGTVDVTFWLSSIYELIDFRTKLLQFCGGTGRWIRPKFFWSNLILPKDLIEFDKTASGDKLDWSSTPAEMIQLQTTNSSEYAIPYQINSIWRLDSLSDGSTKYGADQLTEWRFTATFTWEANIPTFMRLDNFAFKDIKPNLTFSIGPTYASQPLITNFNCIEELYGDEAVAEYLKTYTIYTVNRYSNGKEISPFVKLDNSQCDNYPATYQQYDHIVAAPLLTITEFEKLVTIPEKFILLIDHYDQSYDKYIRLANACICKTDNKESQFFNYITTIDLPTICKIEDRLYNMLLKHVNEDITIDTIAKRIYSGIHKSIQLTANDMLNCKYPEVADQILDVIKNSKSKLQFSDKLNKYKVGNFGLTSVEDDLILGTIESDTKSVKLPFCVSKTLNETIITVYVNDTLVTNTFYTIKGNRIYFNDSYVFQPSWIVKIHVRGLIKQYNLSLAVNYHMTKQDEVAYYTKNKLLSITIPDSFNCDFIRCSSYTGLLNEHDDYECNGNIITFKLEPLRDKVIQIFANRK